MEFLTAEWLSAGGGRPPWASPPLLAEGVWSPGVVVVGLLPHSSCHWLPVSQYAEKESVYLCRSLAVFNELWKRKELCARAFRGINSTCFNTIML